MPRLLAAVISIAVLGVAQAAWAQDTGHDAYMTNCSACHRPDGEGIKGAFPALAGNPFVVGDPAALASLVLKGHGGMPGFAGALSDAKIAAAISYIRGSWGNSAGAVSADTVTKARTALTAPSAQAAPGGNHAP